MCKKYRHEGVVAIDLAGDESLNAEANPEHREAYMVRVIDYMLRNVCSYSGDHLSCNSITDVSKQRLERVCSVCPATPTCLLV